MRGRGHRSIPASFSGAKQFHFHFGITPILTCTVTAPTGRRCCSPSASPTRHMHSRATPSPRGSPAMSKGTHEGIALRLHLEAVVLLQGGAEHVVVQRQRQRQGRWQRWRCCLGPNVESVSRGCFKESNQDRLLEVLPEPPPPSPRPR